MVGSKADLNLYKQSSYLGQSSCCSPNESRKEWPTDIARLDFNEWVGKFPSSQYRLGENINDLCSFFSDLCCQKLAPVE